MLLNKGSKESGMETTLSEGMHWLLKLNKGWRAVMQFAVVISHWDSKNHA